MWNSISHIKVVFYAQEDVHIEEKKVLIPNRM
jgi:hypothetical protein